MSEHHYAADVDAMMDRYGYPAETRQIIAEENLLPTGLLSRLDASYPQHSGLLEEQQRWFTEKRHYQGLDGFREVVAILEEHGIHLWDITERELFVEVYRFRATQHALNSINWQDFEHDSMFQLMFPQPSMMNKGPCSIATPRPLPPRSGRASRATTCTRPTRTTPTNSSTRPGWRWTTAASTWSRAASTSIRQCMLIFDQTTQECFAFCTYCFRHAQVRGDHDMFIQEDVDQVHAYLRDAPRGHRPAHHRRRRGLHAGRAAARSTSSPSSRTRRCCTCAPSAWARAC